MKTSLPIVDLKSVDRPIVSKSTSPDDSTYIPLLPADEQVLPTLSGDGKRRWLNPALAKGVLWQRRRILAYALIAFFVTLPHLRYQGKPIVLLDIASRQFTFFGHTFYPTDTPLVALLMLTAFFSVMFATAVGGRVWCGWACPQTVYLEFLFRPIDRIFAGTVGKGGKPKRTVNIALKTLRLFVYLLCALFLTHTFLSYFVGTDRLAVWIRSSPFEHPVAFLVMAVATAGILYNFLFFREQLCMVACPYGRFQAVMLDRKSLVVGYDERRGEPRHKGKAKSGQVGDCIDCGHCTAVCPTGIDIRKGLQMECIHCAQCIDACDAVMLKIGKPAGLIRYGSQDAMAGKPQSWIRARTLIYPTCIVVAFSLFLVLLSTKFSFDARVLRSPGAPFTVLGTKEVQNNLKIRLVNRSQGPQSYTAEVISPVGSQALWGVDNNPSLAPGETILAPLAIHAPISTTTTRGYVDAVVRIQDSDGNHRDLPFRLLGPR